jgi:hypothetical protein
MLELPKDECGNYPNDCELRLLSAFNDSSAVDIGVYSKKMMDTGIFGLFKKTEKYANLINDINYLQLLLHFMHQEKLNDAVRCFDNCNISKHPKYYINKYKLDKVFQAFRCKGIDISSYLKAYEVDKLYVLEQQHLVGSNYIENCFHGVDAEDYLMCKPPVSPVKAPFVYEPNCCIVPVDPPTDLVNSCVYASPDTYPLSSDAYSCAPEENSVYWYATSLIVNGEELITDFIWDKFGKDNIVSDGDRITNFSNFLNKIFCAIDLDRFQAFPFYNDALEHISKYRMPFYLVFPEGTTFELTIETTACTFSNNPTVDTKFTYTYTQDNFNLGYMDCDQVLPAPVYDRKCCCIEYFAPADSDWLYEHLITYTGAEIGVCDPECDEAFTFNIGEDLSDAFTFNLKENDNCQDFFTFNLNEQNC